jgi:hypothetical protein
MKKAISAATSAALLASLLATVVAPSVAASTLVTSAGVVPVGGTSATASSFQFCENSAGAWHAGGTITVTITPNTAGGSVTFTNATGGAASPTFSQNPGGLGGATASAVGNTLIITVPTDDNSNVLCLTVGNLYISAIAGTTTGAINAAVSGTGATVPGSFASSTTSATGVVALSSAANLTTSLVTVTSSCGFVNVGTLTGTTAAGDFVIGGTDIGAIGTSSQGASSTVPTGGQETLTFPANLAPATTAGVTAVTQANVPNCSLTTLASPGTVGNAVTQTAVTGSLNPGEQNQATGSTTITETAAGYLAAGTVLTFAISAPTTGVTFSTSPTAFVTGGTGLTLGSGTTSALCVLQFGGTSCQVTVDTASTAAASITLAGATTAGVLLDMASTVPNGTAVNVTVTGSPAIVVNVSSNTIANASRVIVGVATQPTIFINYNNQPSGMISLTEAGAGFFTASGANDAFGLCITTGESFTYTPYAIVATGDLKLLTSTSTAATTQVGSLYTSPQGYSCVSWSIYSASTVASTIDIVGATATAALAIGPANGPTLSVPGGLAPGTTQSVILVGSQAGVAAGTASSSLVSNATRMFKSGVVVAAVSQPFVPAGTTDSLAGNLTISETLNGQFKTGQTICVVILPRTSNGSRTQDTFIKTSNTNDLPVITTNSASGLLTSSVGTAGCPSNVFTSSISGSEIVPTPGNSFWFAVNQQSFGGTLGVITVGNIHLITTADAPLGPVLVDVMGSGSGTPGTLSSGRITSVGDSTTGSNTTIVTAANTMAAGNIVTIAGTVIPNINGTYVVQAATSSTFTINAPAPVVGGLESTGGTFSAITSGGSTAVAFETVVSNAQIGTAPTAAAVTASGTALGATKTGPFSISTKVAKLGKYVTWKFSGGSALVGKTVQIWVATKNSAGKWSAFKQLTARRVDASGNAYFWWKTSSKAWISVRGGYLTSLSVATQARWL